MNKNFDTMERVMKLWEVELTSVLDITAVGHRKRILASLENRKKPERSLASLVLHSSQHLEREITLNDFLNFQGGGLRRERKITLSSKLLKIFERKSDIKSKLQNFHRNIFYHWGFLIIQTLISGKNSYLYQFI